MKKILYCVTFILSVLSVSSCSSKRNSTLGKCDYNAVTIIYTDTDIPWESIRVFSITPKIYKSIYFPYLREIQTTDTTFISKLLIQIDERDVLDSIVGIDTWQLVLLHKANSDSVDTLATNWYVNWFNGEVFKDSCVFKLVVDEIIRHDKKWEELVSDYYVDNRWRDYSEIEFEERHEY